MIDSEPLHSTAKAEHERYDVDGKGAQLSSIPLDNVSFRKRGDYHRHV